jgi:5'-nucleotidase
MDKRPLILISNDDGIHAPGIEALSQEARKFADIVIVAPDKQQSAVGHAITMNYPLRVEKVYRDNALYGYAVEGTPADAVKLAVRTLLDRTPDLILSGINHGSNTAISIIYSGTVSAATEGTVLGIPSIAFSLTTYDKPDFRYAAKFAGKLAQKVLENGLPPGVLLNVNIPPFPEEEIRGVVITRQGRSVWNDTFESRRDPNNREYFWLTGELTEVDATLDDDQYAVTQRYISITPIHYDLTDYEMIEEMKKWNIGALK